MLRELLVLLFPISVSLRLGRTLSIVIVMAAEVQMVLYEDDSVQVQYTDGSRLQLSPCGSEFLFEKAPPVSAHPLEQPERIRQRTHFVISTYRVSKDVADTAHSVSWRWAEYGSNLDAGLLHTKWIFIHIFFKIAFVSFCRSSYREP